MVIGLNQVSMFAVFMILIAAYIRTQDLGKNFVLGIRVALMALTFDLTIMK